MKFHFSHIFFSFSKSYPSIIITFLTNTQKKISTVIDLAYITDFFVTRYKNEEIQKCKNCIAYCNVHIKLLLVKKNYVSEEKKLFRIILIINQAPKKL